jgi:hypothetical protein
MLSKAQFIDEALLLSSLTQKLTRVACFPLSDFEHAKVLHDTALVALRVLISQGFQ